MYPDIPTLYVQHSLFFKILLFVSACAAILAVTINILLPDSGMWSVFVVAGLSCIWLLIFVAARKRHNMLKNVMYQAFLISLITIVWDLFMNWHGWSLTYVLPIVWICAMISVAILNKVLELHVFEQLIYVVMLIFFGITPLIFVLTKIVSNVYPSLVCIVGSVISLVALLIFKGESLKAEMNRRFHI